ncbi:MAG TPA: hypothetical protein VFS43_20205 [Polyangiaceae bacterium]|nr:hypothetical protein [Polyangiaceae bacterium]
MRAPPAGDREPPARERPPAREALSVDEVDDQAMLARAAAATGEQRLAWLDTVAGRKGRRAAEAATLARAERLAEVRRHLEAGAAPAALAACERAFPSWDAAWQSDREVQALRAQAYDLAFVACADDPCRLDASTKAHAAAPTPERASRAGRLRGQLAEALTLHALGGEPTVTRLRRLGSLASLATELAGAADPAIRAKARAALDFADAERAKVPLIGNDDGVASELLGPLRPKGPGVSWVELDGVETFLVLDARRKCRGVYAVGRRGSRPLPSSGRWTADRLLSQALGRPAALKKPAAADGTVQWAQGPTPVVVRWREGRPIEMRVGDAAP